MDVKEWVHAFACKFDMIVSLSALMLQGVDHRTSRHSLCQWLLPV